MFKKSTKFYFRDAMHYWAKCVYIGGLFSAEVYLNYNSKNSLDVVNFLTMQRSIDRSTKSELMGQLTT